MHSHHCSGGELSQVATRAQSPESLTRFQAGQIPDNFPGTEASEETKQRRSTGFQKAGQVTSRSRQVFDTVQAGEVGEDAVKCSIPLLVPEYLDFLGAYNPELRRDIEEGAQGFPTGHLDHARGGITGQHLNSPPCQVKRIDAGPAIDFQNSLARMEHPV